MLAAGHPQAGPLREVRLPLGDERLPVRDRGQHPARPDPRPDRRGGHRQHLAGQGVVGDHPPGADRRAVAARRAAGDRGARSWPASLPPVAAYGAVLALVIPTVAAVLLGRDVESVGDTGEIPAGLPVPHLPSLGLLSPGLVVGGLSVAAIVLVQGYGVSQSVPNSDGRPSSASRDFAAQGVGNLAAACVRGPAGRRLGRPDRDERRCGRRLALGRHLLRRSGCSRSWWLSPRWSARPCCPTLAADPHGRRRRLPAPARRSTTSSGPTRARRSLR